MLYPYQQQGIDFLKTRRTALLADDMGLGKTVQLIQATKEVKAKKILVISPASVKQHWASMFDVWAPGQYLNKDVVYGRKHRVDTHNSDLIVVNYDLLDYDLEGHGAIIGALKSVLYDLIICDEAHYLKNHETVRFKGVLGSEGLINHTKRIWISTGTPVLNRPVELYGILKVLYPEAIKDCLGFEQFATVYCDGKYSRYGFLAAGATNVEDLAERINPFYLRRTKEQVLTDLPPVVESSIPLEYTEEIQAVFESLDDQEFERAMSNEIRSKYDRYQQQGWTATQRRQLAEAKIPQVVTFINDILGQKDKVVVFAYHRNVIEELKKYFHAYGVCVVTGSTPNKQSEVDKFINGPNRVFIGNYISAGQGVDGLQRICDTVVFAEFSWVPGENDQARDRLHRIGQNNPVFSYTLYLPGTLEETMIYTNRRKRKVINTLITSDTLTIGEKHTMACLETELSRLTAVLETFGNKFDTVIALLGEQVGNDDNFKAAMSTEAKAPVAKAPAKAPAAKAKAPAAKKEVSVTLDDIRPITKELMAKSEDKKATAQEIALVLKSHGAKEGKSLDEVPATNYEGLYADLLALVPAESVEEEEVILDF